MSYRRWLQSELGIPGKGARGPAKKILTVRHCFVGVPMTAMEAEPLNRNPDPMTAMVTVAWCLQHLCQIMALASLYQYGPASKID